MIRLFVGIEIPEDIRKRIAALGGGIPGARWLPPENIHLTIRFIGGVDEGLRDDIETALGTIRAPAFDLVLEGVNYFGPPRAPRSIHVGVRRNEALVHLHDKVESALVRLGLAPEERKFAPHLTFARLRNAPSHRVNAFIAANNLFRAGPFRVESFTLFSSFPSNGGSIYRQERVYPLLPKPAAAPETAGDQSAERSLPPPGRRNG